MKEWEEEEKIDNQIRFHFYKIQKLINLITKLIKLIICILLKLFQYKSSYRFKQNFK